MTRRRRTPVPRHRQLISNPEATDWVRKVIAESWETMQQLMPADYLPRLTGVQPLRGPFISARADTYGCGTYGCVYPTLSDDIVLKVTSDDTEANFANLYANGLVAPICVRYRGVIQLEEQYRGSPIFLLWRESADQVGEIDSVLGEAAHELVNRQHEAAQAAYKQLHNEEPFEWEIQEWLSVCQEMAFQTEFPELHGLAAGLIKVWEQQHIFFGDIHTGNLGLVARPGGPQWVITDPGHIAVIDPDAYAPDLDIDSPRPRASRRSTRRGVVAS